MELIVSLLYVEDRQSTGDSIVTKAEVQRSETQLY